MPQSLPNGTVLNNRFKIRRLLSEGPLGAVYLVDDVKITEKPWVCREYLPLPVSAGERMSAEDTFHKTVDFLKTLSHQNLVRVIDSFTEGNRSYLISEYVDGLSLEAVSSLTGTPLPESQVLEWAIQICDPLEYLHNLPVPFYIRDLSPRYLLLDRDGQIKIGGFGLDLIFAKAYKMALPGVAPELDGDKQGNIAADIYSFGACLYILLARKMPKPPITPPRQANSQISEGTDNLLVSCLSEDPSKRPAGVPDLQARFRHILNPPKVAPPPRPRVTLGEIIRRMESRMVGAVVSIVEMGLALYKRPYYLVLGLLVIAAFFFTFKPFAEQPFQKTGPLAYALCHSDVVVVDPVTFREVARIPNLQAQFSVLSPSDHQLWFASNDGRVTGVDEDAGLINKRFNLHQTIGGIAMGPGGIIYVSMDRDNTLMVIGPNGIPLSIIPVGRIPRDIAYDSSMNKLFVASGGASVISVIDTSKYLVGATISLGAVPSHIALSSDGAYLFVVYDGLRRLDVFSASNNSLATSSAISVSGPYSVASSGNAAAVTAHDGNQLLLFQAPGWTTGGTIPLDNLEDAVFSPDGRTVYACNDSGYLFAVSAKDGRITRQAYIGKSPVNLLAVP